MTTQSDDNFATANSLPNGLQIPDLRARRIADHLSLVQSMALRVHAALPRHIGLGDLIHAGMLGLNDAASRFDPSKEVVFPSYAKHRIQGSILDGLRQANYASDDLRQQLTTVPLQLSVVAPESVSESKIAAR